DPIAVTLEQPHRVGTGPILELNAAARELRLHRADELLDELVELLVRGPRLSQSQIQRIGEERLVVRPGVDQDGQRQPGRNAAGRRVQRELADRYPHPVRAKIAKSEDPLTTGDDDETHVALRPVA